jgi:hypothetical protein
VVNICNTRIASNAAMAIDKKAGVMTARNGNVPKGKTVISMTTVANMTRVLRNE